MPRLGIDVGGTFVDVVCVLDDGSAAFEKVLADPGDLMGAIAHGIQSALVAAGARPESVREVVHATTRGSNTVLERSGPRVALLATEGFRDILQIQRALRWSMYDVQLDKPVPLVARSHSFGIPERVLADGSVRTPLDEEAVRAAADLIRQLRIDTVAVAFLHSYANPSHEARAREIVLEEIPGALVSISSGVSLQAREYERANTAVVNAYIGRSISDYLEELAALLPQVGITAPLWIMQSSGGLASVEQAVSLPVRTLESGPSAGVLAAARFGRSAGFDDVISFDMGGTTAKAAVVQAGIPATTTYFELERLENRRGSGLPVDIPALDLVEIGTGGGSIARAVQGILRVGPRSAGADPGPACYGRGGVEATVTDANLLLGYYDDAFAGGMRLDVPAAAAAVDRLAAEVGMDRLRTAWGIHEVATLDMEHAIRLVSINRGFDPRGHALVCIGGAGPAHGARLARNLGVRVALVPPAASGGSAFGLLEASESVEVVRTAVIRLDEARAGERCAELLRGLEAEAGGGVWGNGGTLTARRTVGLRYVGQGHELHLPLTADPGDARALAESFHAGYERTYGYREESQPVEAVSWSLALVRESAAARGERTWAPRPHGLPAATRRSAFFPETGELEVDVRRRDDLRPGDTVEGPLLVTEPTTTTVVLPEDRLEVTEDGTLVIRIGRDG